MSGLETIIWTALPTGVSPDGTELNLSVFVAPTLAGGPQGQISDFSDFVNWPQTIVNDKVSFLIQVSDAGLSQRGFGVGTYSTAAFNLQLWPLLFVPTTPYEPRPEFDARSASLAVVTYPPKPVSDFVTGQYGAYAPDAVPDLDTLKGVFAPISGELFGVTQAERERRLAAERAELGPHGRPRLANDFTRASPGDAFAAFSYYHRAPAGEAPTPTLPDVDFHRALTFVGQHGPLQRALALVIEMTVPIAQINNPDTLITGTPRSDLYVSVVAPTLGNPNRSDYQPVTPWTQCTVSTSVFEPYAASSQIVGRQLTLADTNSFTVHELDVDAAGFSTLKFASVVSGGHPLSANARADADRGNAAVKLGIGSPPPPTLPITTAPPALRSNGFSIAEVNRGVAFQAAVQAQVDLLSSLTQGGVTYLTAENLVRGYVLDVWDSETKQWRSTSLCRMTYAAGSQTVAGVAEPPALAPPRIQNSPQPDSSEQQLNLSPIILRFTGWSNAAPRYGKPLPDADSLVTNPDVPFKQLTITTLPVAGSVPRLRFGVQYVFRARIVDMANDALPLSQGAAVGDPQQRTTVPVTYQRLEPIGSPDVIDQSAPRLGESKKRLVIRDIDSGTPSLRALAPKRVSPQFAEAHSMFDTGTAGRLDPHAYPAIAAAADAAYPDANPLALGDTPPQIKLGDPVPYLPDPVCRGARLSLNGTVVNVDFSPAAGDTWPHARPFGLELAAGTTLGATVDAGSRIATFTLTPADVFQLAVSSTCELADLALLGISYYFGSSWDPATAASGQYWALTPAETLELVYAVQQPLVTPELTFFAPVRDLGSTSVPLLGKLDYSPKSTGKIDIVASWSEPVDDPLNDRGPQGPGAPDTTLVQAGNVPVYALHSSATVTDPTTEVLEDSEEFQIVHEFHDTKHRDVAYSAVAASRFTEFYPDGTDVTKTSQHPPTVSIPSSARPASVAVAYVVPVYSWTQEQHGGQHQSNRSAASLRVFIERPWWSSGDGELLGVVTWPFAEDVTFVLLERDHGRRRASAAGHRRGAAHAHAASITSDSVNELDRPYVTDWGADPVFASQPAPWPHPRLESFLNATTTQRALSIEESPDVLVNVAGHPVTYDPNRGLWYCDIRTDTGGAYMPMIRLAVARYQPNSVAGAELSRISLVDVMTLDPARAVSITRHGNTLTTVTLAGISYHRAANLHDGAPGVAQLVIQRHDDGVADPELGWDAVKEPIRMHPHNYGSFFVWEAKNVKLPGKGRLRLLVQEFEVLPTDDRRTKTIVVGGTRGYRLVHQDVIPL